MTSTTAVRRTRWQRRSRTPSTSHSHATARMSSAWPASCRTACATPTSWTCGPTRRTAGRASPPAWCATSPTRSPASTSACRPTTPKPSTCPSASSPSLNSCPWSSAPGSPTTPTDRTPPLRSQFGSPSGSGQQIAHQGVQSAGQNGGEGSAGGVGGGLGPGPDALEDGGGGQGEGVVVAAGDDLHADGATVDDARGHRDDGVAGRVEHGGEHGRGGGADLAAVDDRGHGAGGAERGHW